MTQPAKAQEPSMEEILASIRRIIADDEAKPAAAPVAAAKPEPPKPAPPSKPVAMTLPPAASSPAPAAAKPAAPPKPAPAPPPKPAAPPPAASDAGNSQDDIDALLAGLDASTTEEEVRPAPAPPPEPEPEPDVLELTDDMALPEPPAPTPLPHPPFHKAPLANDLEFAEAAPRPRAPEPAPPSSWSAEPPAAPMLSQTTVAAVESAFNSLASTVLSNNARTLEDLVKEMLRPMLKSWLDDNLPTLVERIVRQEIERVSRGR